MDLEQTLSRLLVSGKGILAADESGKTANLRLAEAGVGQNEENRRQYRQLLFTTPGIANGLSGVILHDETIRQKADNGQSFVELLQGLGIVVGIKTDLGLVDLAGSPGEKVSTGLEDLAERSQEYYRLGARFAKWRSVIRIADGLPTEEAIKANAEVLAKYAKLSQANGLVPIVEPEVLLEGDHTLGHCQQVLTQTLSMVFDQLKSGEAGLGQTILKTSMVLPGKDSTEQANPTKVAEATVEALKSSVPEAVPGVVFLSGGQTPAKATEHLNQIAKLGPHPWLVTFSYSRALQDPVLKHWAGNPSNLQSAQAIFAKRIKLAALAQRGKYSLDMEANNTRQTISGGQD